MPQINSRKSPMRMAPSTRLKRKLLFSADHECLSWVAATSGTNLYMKMKNPMPTTMFITIIQLLISGGFASSFWDDGAVGSRDREAAPETACSFFPSFWLSEKEKDASATLAENLRAR